MRGSYFYSALTVLPAALGQGIESLRSALSAFPQASQFTTYLTAHPTTFTSLFANVSSASPGAGITVLIPSNDAISKYQTTSGLSFASLTADQITTLFKYHVLVAPITSANFSQPGGLTVPTLLKDEKYNNRSAGAQLQALFGKNANGQVLYFSTETIAATKKMRVRVRQSQAKVANVRAGQSEVTNVDVVDGTWDGGKFQIIDEVLVAPAPCSGTIRPVAQLSALDAALNKTNLWDTLDHAPNVTCLAPNTKAFASAGNPQDSLTQQQLAAALLFHTLPMPLYSNFITDGMELISLGNLTVRMTVNSTGTYFNDARVVAQNVLTNNGVIHILDKIMSPLNATSTKGSPTSTPTSTGSAAATTTAKGSASGLFCSGYLLGLVSFMSAAILI